MPTNLFLHEDAHRDAIAQFVNELFDQWGDLQDPF